MRFGLSIRFICCGVGVLKKVCDLPQQAPRLYDDMLKKGMLPIIPKKIERACAIIVPFAMKMPYIVYSILYQYKKRVFYLL